MADLLRLDDFRARAARRLSDETPKGEILLFTGVRYERLAGPGRPKPRLTDADTGPRPARRSGTKSKKH